jgi:hypothetical protein
MGKLRSGVSSKVADATGALIHGSGQLFRTDPLSIPNPFPVGPVLTKEAIKGASVIKNGKVFKPIFWTRSMSESGVS